MYCAGLFFFFKQKTAYEMRISDWSSDVCSSDLATMLAFGLWVFGSAVWGFIAGSAPHAETMGMIGALALAAHVAVALMLYRYRTGDANMRSVWICSRNDAIGKIARMGAALGVFGTRRSRPDLAAAGSSDATPTETP